MEMILKIEGMSCAHCARAVKDALEAVTGVVQATVDLDAKTARVEISETVEEDALRAAVDEAGYTVLA